MKLDVVNTLDKMYGLQNRPTSIKKEAVSKNNPDNEKIKSSDSLEISSEVRKIQIIKNRISDDTYSSNDVIQEVTKRMIEYSVI